MHQIKPLCCELARTFGREGIAIAQSFPSQEQNYNHCKVKMIKALVKKNFRDFHISEKFIDIFLPYVFFLHSQISRSLQGLRRRFIQLTVFESTRESLIVCLRITFLCKVAFSVNLRTILYKYAN